LPELLTTEINDWQAAGAAVCTALARIDKLDGESLHRGWPPKRSSHLSRATSDCSGLGSPEFSASHMLGSSPRQTPAALHLLHTTLDNTPSASVNSPPFTPQDSIMGDTIGSISSSFREKVSLEHVNAILATRVRRASESGGSPSPLMTPVSRQDSIGSGDNLQDQFDEGAWDVFLRSYEAELDYLRTETLVRFRHIGKSVDRLWIDLGSDGSHSISEAVSKEFVAWWKKMNDKEQEYEKEIQMLEAPQLELVSYERASQGLPV
jgi:hypothetical protein